MVVGNRIACNVVVTGIYELDAVDAATVVIADIVACYDIVAGIDEEYALHAVADIVVCYGIVAGRGKVNVVPFVVVGIVVCNGVVAGVVEEEAVIVVADVIVLYA
jgi:hypothetical protein